MNIRVFPVLLLTAAGSAFPPPGLAQVDVPDIPDTALARTYERAAVQNVLAAVNPNVFYGYFSVCADGRGFGYGNTYPSLDGHQMSDALLWLGEVGVVEANWNYVKSFQREDGLLPIGIFPAMPGKDIGPKGYPAVATGPNTYCEYPANYIRIMQRFLLGVEFMLDASIRLDPTVTDEFWDKGFGQTLRYRGRTLRYRMTRRGIDGAYSGSTGQHLLVFFPPGFGEGGFSTEINGRKGKPFPLSLRAAGPVGVDVTLPSTREGESCSFFIRSNR